VDWSQPIPVRTNSLAPSSDKYENSNVNTTTPGTPPRDYEWEAYQQHVEVDGEGDSWERLPAEPEETNDDVFEDENDEEDQIATDLTIRIGRMIICENVTGFFRPQYAEEVILSFRFQSSSVLVSVQLLRRPTSLESSYQSIPIHPLRLLTRERPSHLRYYPQSRCLLSRHHLLYFWGLQRLFPKEMT
jgi:hypothetical protein